LERELALRRQQRGERRNLFLILGGLVATGAVILAVALLLNAQDQATTRHHLAFKAQPDGAIAGIKIPDEGTPNHIDPSTTWHYKFYPPTSGPHYGPPEGPAPWQTVGPMAEGTFVHNLEHGGIAILYDCPQGCATLQQRLAAYVRFLVPAEPVFGEYKMVMTPYSRGMTHPVALVAWHWIEWLDGYDQAEITRFYEIHADHGPEQIR
jgi:hypothetical protein